MEGDAIDMKELLDILNKVKPGIDYVNEKHLVSDELIGTPLARSPTSRRSCDWASPLSG